LGFIGRHSLSPIARFMFRANQGDLFIGRDMAMPVADAESLMRRYLNESRRTATEPADAPERAARISAPRGRRPVRKR
jgi:hypothetical protein